MGVKCINVRKAGIGHAIDDIIIYIEILMESTKMRH